MIEPATPIELPVIDLSGHSEARRDMETEAGRPFDLGAAPHGLAHAWRLAGDEHLAFSVLTLFETPTVGRYAARIAERGGGAG